MQPQLALIASLIGSFSRGLKTSWSLRAGFVFKAAPSRRGLAPFASLVPSWFGAEPPALVGRNTRRITWLSMSLMGFGLP